MRFFVSIFILLSIGVFQSQQPIPGDPIARAEAAYTQGDYVAAQQLYTSLLDLGFRDGSLYFDLANAYKQSGDLGRALLNYKRAQQFIPRDSVLNEQISLIRAGRVDIQPDESGVLADLTNMTISLLTIHEFLLLLSIIWSLAGGLLTARMLWSQYRERMRLSLIACGVVLIVGLILLVSRLAFEATYPAAVVLEAKVAVMTGPGEQYFNLFDLHSAAEVRVVAERGNWVWVELSDDRQGWIPTAAVERVRQ